ncbi:hypothetical protein [Planctomicrobium sp. SH664]|uniref:hypothetical protein n=1 Tax=Planctomicrobium sp. SH664 TaxID=3448125 RepID=UPI003F5B3956
MKKLFALALVLGAATAGWAREPMFSSSESLAMQPTPVQPQGAAQNLIPVPEDHIPATGGTIVPGYLAPSAGLQPGTIICNADCAGSLQLYRAIKVRAPRNIAPCAVEKIVSVPDPCNPCRCVLIPICVPPCKAECITCSKQGDRVTFDYGKYSVDVTARRGGLVVTYHD